MNTEPDPIDAEDDALEPWERCGCAACQATMAILYGDPSEIPAQDEAR